MLKNSAKVWLRRLFPPRVFDSVRLVYWDLSVYARNRLLSPVVKRRPTVYTFGSGPQAQELGRRLRNLNVLETANLCRVMSRHGSDKAIGWHNYTIVYSELFKEIRHHPLRVFELGLGTNNPGLVSTMGSHGKPGASLRGWREYFPNALVYGADIDRTVLFEEDRIRTFYCDQLDQSAIRDLWSQPELHGGLNVIIEDGLHTFDANVSFLDGSLNKLAPGGTYVIEDIERSTLPGWKDCLEKVYSGRYPGFVFALVELPNANPYDNNLLVIQKISA